MKAARLHAYHDALKLDSIDEPKITSPFDVIVRVGAAGLGEVPGGAAVYPGS